MHRSTNARFRCLRYGMRRLAKIEKGIGEKLKKQAQYYNKNYPRQMLHSDTERLPLVEEESSRQTIEYLFVAIDNFSRELHAVILPDKPHHAS